VPSIHDTRRFLEARRASTAEELYGRAREQGLNISPQLQRLLDENEVVRNAFDRVTRENAATRMGTDRAPLDPVTLMHQTKQAIVDTANAATTGGNPTQRAFRDLADDFVGAFKDANPAVRAADARYREMKSLYDNVSGEGWLTHGQNFMKKGTSDAAVETSTSALRDYIPRLTPEQLMTFRVGTSNTMRDAAEGGAKSTRRLADSIVENTQLQQKLSQIYDQGTADRLLKQSGRELKFAKEAQDVLGGSHTGQRVASLSDELGLSISPSTSPASLVQMLAQGYQKMRQPNEAVRSQLADLLANADRSTNKETLRMVEAMLKQPSRARPFGAGIAGTSGGSSTPSNR
jgi:post-segregation antitoxin (ccd killing protein)